MATNKETNQTYEVTLTAVAFSFWVEVWLIKSYCQWKQMLQNECNGMKGVTIDQELTQT